MSPGSTSGTDGGRQGSGQESRNGVIDVTAGNRTAGGIPERILPVVVLVPLILFACTAESPQSGGAESSTPPPAPVGSPPVPHSNHPPSVRTARIVPDPARLSEAILVQVEAEDPDGDPVAFRFQWLANGNPIAGATESTLDSRDLKRGDLLSVEVVPRDGQMAGSPYRTESVPVGNSPPEVTSLTVKPDRVGVGDRVRAQAAGRDADQDSITYRFKWWRNNVPLPGGEEGVLETKGLNRGDTIVAQATPFDAVGAGKPLFSEPVTLANSPPTITSVPPTAVDQGRYSYTVTAVDPDGDPLTYRLDTAPRGMTIDPASGRIAWPLTAETLGTHRVRVTVEDGQGGHSFQEFELSLPAPVPTPPSGPG